MTGKHVARIISVPGAGWLEYDKDYIKGEFDYERAGWQHRAAERDVQRQSAMQLVDASMPFLDAGIADPVKLYRKVLEGLRHHRPDRVHPAAGARCECGTASRGTTSIAAWSPACTWARWSTSGTGGTSPWWPWGRTPDGGSAARHGSATRDGWPTSWPYASWAWGAWPNGAGARGTTADGRSGDPRPDTARDSPDAAARNRARHRQRTDTARDGCPNPPGASRLRAVRWPRRSARWDAPRGYATRTTPRPTSWYGTNTADVVDLRAMMSHA